MRHGKNLQPNHSEKPIIREYSDFIRSLDFCLSNDELITSERELWKRMDECLPPGEDVVMLPRRKGRQLQLTSGLPLKIPLFMLVLCNSSNFAERAIDALKLIYERKAGSTPNFIAVVFFAVSWSGKNERQLRNLGNVLRGDFGVERVCVKTPAIKGAPVRCQ